MAKKIELEEFIDLEEKLMELDEQETEILGADEEPLSEGVYYLLDDSFIFRVSGRLYKNPQ